MASLKLLNGFMSLLLRSPLHPLVGSKRVMVVSFKGKKSGKEYRTPVSYTRDGDRVTFFSRAEWVNNLAPHARISMRIRGQEYSGDATPCDDDPKAIGQGLSRHLTLLKGENRYYKVRVEKGKPVKEDMEKAAGGVTMVRVRIKK